MPNPCTVTGVLKDAAGDLLTSTRLTFQRTASLQAVEGEDIVAPVFGTALAASSSIVTDATTAAFEIDLMPGVYALAYHGRTGIERVSLSVPVADTADLAELIGQATTIDSTIAQIAIQARDAAEGFADDAAASAVLTAADRVQTGLDRIAAAASAAAAASSEADAEAARDQATLAAQAAGAPMFASLAAGEAGTANGDVFMVKTDAGVQVYENASGSGSLLGWLGEVLFDDVPALLASTLTGFSVGHIIRTRKEGFPYKVVSIGEHLTTAGGVKLRVVPTFVGASGGITTPAAWGIDLTGTTDNRLKFQAMCRSGWEVLLPDGAIIDGAGGSITLNKSVRIFGSRGANACLLRDLTIESTGSFQSVVCEGFRFGTSEASGAGLPPAALDLTNIDHVRIRDCEFTNVRVVVDADGTKTNIGAVVEGNRITADWSAWGAATQNDLLTIRGFQFIRVHGNYFNGTQVNRFMKLSIATTVADPVTAYNDRGVIITENAMTGAGGTRGKQMIDCFSGTVQLLFANNWCTATGHTDVIENKTAYSYAQTDTVLSHKIVNNYIVCDARAVLYQGSYGVTDWTPNGYDDLLISGNTILKRTANEATIDVRFLHDFKTVSNVMKTAEGVGAVYHVSAASCRSNDISHNTMEGGEVLISKATSNAGGETFNSEPRSVIFNSNVLREYDISAALTCKDLTSLESLVITSNIVETSLNAAVTAAFWVRSCVVKRVLCTGNAANHNAAPAKNKLHCTFSTIDVCREAANSWSPAMKNLANSATPSLKSVSSSVSVAGGDLYQTGGSTAITNLVDGYEGQTVTIYFNQSVTIINGASIRLSGGANFSGTLYDILTLQNVAGNWIERSRSVN